MYSRLPSPYNANKQFSTEPQFRNPAGTNPLPTPQNMPSPCWFGNRQILDSWTTVAGEGNELFWASPIFDLQPQLRGLVSQNTTGSTFSGNENASRGLNSIPIWGGGALHLQISNLLGASTSLTELRLFTIEEAHVSDSGALVQVLPSADVTQQLNTTTDSVILNFCPLGEGSNVRFWRCKLRFTRADIGGIPLPIFYINSGYY